MKKFFQEFKAFALKGNVLDMAIGVIIAGAFQNIVTALTENIINPIIGLLFQMDFSAVVIRLTPNVSLNIGAFISAIINFLLMALVLFCIVKAITKVSEKAKKKEEEEAAAAPAGPTTEELLTQILEEIKKKQ
ncbi:MAG: large conductance mechanosensitive channel protein MscL [Lachnospiraceae bacterium]|nr:large conductance mechanosensitive channel protein MscL [Lachnospiraceae bacterium]